MVTDTGIESSVVLAEKRENNPTLLLVDDDLAILEGVADLLELHGYNVITATGGCEALQAMHEQVPDLVISDIMMREMDGYEFYEEVRKNPAWTMLPFIFLTARGQTIDIRRGHSLGADAYLTKPFEPEDLLIAIRARLKRMDDIRDVTRADVDQVKQQLMTIFSHELRTPLSYIYGYVHLLEEGHKGLDDQAIDEILGDMRQGAERLVRLTEDLMQIVYIDSGAMVLRMDREGKKANISPLILQAIRELDEKAEKRRVIVSAQIPDQLTIWCVGDFVQDAVRRLVDNAIKFSKREDGHVWVRAEMINDWVVITIQDDGIGIDPANLKLIFERFRQLDREKLEQQGIGLGLALADRLVDLHGGHIEVESEPGVGSTFTLYLPVEGGAGV
jgi:two-component system sensor histidine kinase/response regulator